MSLIFSYLDYSACSIFCWNSSIIFWLADRFSECLHCKECSCCCYSWRMSRSCWFLSYYIFSSFYFISFILCSLLLIYCWSMSSKANSSFWRCWLPRSMMEVFSCSNASIYVFCSLVSSSNILMVEFFSWIY